MYDIVIIGAGTAGLTAAVYAQRAAKRVLVLEGETFGGQIALSPNVENFPGTAQMSGVAFADRLVEQALGLGAQVEFERALGLKPLEGGQGWRVLGERKEYPCSSVILATGLKHRKLGLQGEHEMEGISYCALCDGAFYKGQTVCVVGGGDTALQEALYLSDICNKVYLVHRRAHFRAEAYLQQAVSRHENIQPIMDAVIEELVGQGELQGLKLRYTAGHTENLNVSGLFVAIGQIPQNAVFEDAVALDQDGYILAKEDCITTAPGVFVAGDCRTKQVRQLTTAAADGAVAAVAACQWVDRLR